MTKKHRSAASGKRAMPFTTALLGCGLLLAGCTGTAATVETIAPLATNEPLQSEQASAAVSDYDLAPSAVMAENRDYTTVGADEWSESDAIEVKLSGSGLSGTAAGVTVSGGTVTIAQAGVYRLSGSLNGQVMVEAPDDALVVLILDGATIASTTGSAIEIRTADDAAIHLAAGSENSVSDAASYADDAEANAAIWADTDLTISGEGSLTVTGNGNDGITSKDALVILGGSIAVTAADDALRGKDSLVVEGGALELKAHAGDGMKSDGDDGKASTDIDWARGYIYVSGGEISIEAGDDGLQAFTDTVIAGGALIVSAADDGVKAEVIVSIGQETDTETSVTVTNSIEGIEAANVGISGGIVNTTASDDAINASGNAELQALIAGVDFTGVADREADSGERLEISGGDITVRAGADGLDSNGTVTITGGNITITSAANGGDGPVDANGTITVADGVTIMANGSAWDPATAGGMGGPGGFGGGPGGGQPPMR